MAKSPVQNGHSQVRDITTMTQSDIEAYLKQRKAEQAKLVALKGVEARKDVEAYCLNKHGLTLAQIFMASSNATGPKTYRNPTTGQTYTYSGRGKVPEWPKDHNGKPNAAYAVN